VSQQSGSRFCSNSDITVPPSYFQIQGMEGHNCQAVFQWSGPATAVRTPHVISSVCVVD
jgi:hypothetical protein